MRHLHIFLRPECKAQVNRVPYNVYQGFNSRLAAERAYVVAFALGAVRVLPGRGSSTRPAPAAPAPDAVMCAFASADEYFLGAEWHVVFKGKRPGVYPAWYGVSSFAYHIESNTLYLDRNFAATQVTGVRLSLYNKYATKAEAIAAFQAAERAGHVEYL